MTDPAGEVTVLLGQLRQGDQDAAARLLPLVYQELRRIAGGLMRNERHNHTLQATALVHEAYLRLAGSQPSEWQSRAHFFGVAAQAMREVLLDYARRRQAEKRGGRDARQIEMDEEFSISAEKLEDVLVVDDLLRRLTEIDPRQGRVVELRFFGGLNVEETAEVMGVSPKTVKRDWRSARAWLHRELDTATP